ncbi:hypothetical protein JHW43_003340 [Diplocarpon mali]|nr:hypothetical protein JHW43_003340 [Diplocarpon mali]
MRIRNFAALGVVAAELRPADSLGSRLISCPRDDGVVLEHVSRSPACVAARQPRVRDERASSPGSRVIPRPAWSCTSMGASVVARTHALCPHHVPAGCFVVKSVASASEGHAPGRGSTADTLAALSHPHLEIGRSEDLQPWPEVVVRSVAMYNRTRDKPTS